MCEDCYESIDHRHGNTTLCKKCAIRRRDIRNHYKRTKNFEKWAWRKCVVCGVDISHLHWKVRACSEVCRITYCREYIRSWRERNPHSTLDYYQENKEAHSERVKRYRSTRKDVVAGWQRASYRKWHNDATRPMPSRCEACGDLHDSLEFDHNHETGEFRGWLCGHCNKALGLAKDSVNRLLSLITYLETNSQNKKEDQNFVEFRL